MVHLQRAYTYQFEQTQAVFLNLEITNINNYN